VRILANRDAIETMRSAAEVTRALCTTTLGRFLSVNFLVMTKPTKRA